MRPRDKINKQKKKFLTLVAIGFAAMILLAFTEKYITYFLNQYYILH